MQKRKTSLPEIRKQSQTAPSAKTPFSSVSVSRSPPRFMQMGSGLDFADPFAQTPRQTVPNSRGMQVSFTRSCALYRVPEYAGTNIKLFSKDTEREKRLKTPSYVGEEAYSSYYRKYRRLSREREDSPEGYSATTAYLSKCESMKVVPSPIGIIKWKGKESEISAK